MITKEFVEGMFKRRPNLGLSLVLVFKTDANVRIAMHTLLQLHQVGVLSIADRDMIVVLAMRESGSYERTENRNVHVRLSGFEPDPNRFNQLTQYLDTIKLANEHQLELLQSSRQKKREEALAQITSTWVSDQVRSLVDEWGLKISILPELDGPFHMCKIVIYHDTNEVTSITLDGWSGLMCHKNTWLTDRQAHPQRVDELLLVDLDIYLDILTQ